MTRAKKAKKTSPVGRDSKGKPISLKSKRVTGFDVSDADKLAQRRGDGIKGSMGKEHDTALKRRSR